MFKGRGKCKIKVVGIKIKGEDEMYIVKRWEEEGGVV